MVTLFNYAYSQNGNPEQYPYNTNRLISTPEKFHPDAISTKYDKFNTSFSPAGDTMYFTLTARTLGITGIAFQVFGKDEISSPEFLPFVSHDIPTADVQISPDGKTLLFSTFKDFEGKPEGFNFNLWKSTRSGNNWLAPQAIPGPITSSGNEFYPILTKSGSLFFNSDRGGNSDIFIIVDWLMAIMWSQLNFLRISIRKTEKQMRLFLRMKSTSSSLEWTRKMDLGKVIYIFQLMRVVVNGRIP